MKILHVSKIGLTLLWITLAMIVCGGVATYYRGGFNLGIDFSSGVSMQFQILESTNVDEIRELLSNYETIHVQRTRTSGRFIIKVSENESNQDLQLAPAQIESDLGSHFGQNNVSLLESAYIGPRFSANIIRQFITLGLGALVLIMLYAWFRFKFSYALAALAALFHDVLFMIGFIGAFQVEISTTTVAAVLTVIGYSLNDTIVIFDRIRENQTLMHEASISTIIDTSITQSLSRTLITSLTTLLAVLAIYIFSDGAIQYFALNMIVGVTIGTFSSIFVASALLHKRMSSQKSPTIAKTEPPQDTLQNTPNDPAATLAKPKPKSDDSHISKEIEARKKMLATRQLQRKKKKR